MKCKQCGNEATTILEEFRHMVRCGWCGYHGYLKEYNAKVIHNEPVVSVDNE